MSRQQDAAGMAGAGWFQAVLDSLQEHIAVLDAQGRIMAVNQAWNRFALDNGGLPDRYGAGVDYLEVLRASLARGGDRYAEQAYQGLTDLFAGRIEIYELEYPYDAPDRPRWFLLHATPLRGGEGFVLAHIDITARKLSELGQQQAYAELDEAHRRLQQSDRQALVGQLAAGMAHEINTPAGYIQSNLKSLTKYLQGLLDLLQAYRAALVAVPDADLRAGLEAKWREADADFLYEDAHVLIKESQQGIEWIDRLVRDLQDFAQVEKEMPWQWHDLRRSVSRARNMLANEFRDRITVCEDLRDAPELWCQPQQIDRVAVNLLLNAAQAIEGEGVIKLAVRAESEGVLFTVEDNGRGMAPESLQRIFQPFFTTKPVGEGTGLGLSLVEGIVHQHGGKVTVQSQPGGGAVFQVWLPRVPPGMVAPEGPTADHAACRGEEGHRP